MKMTFRWYGSNSDSVTLKQIKQIPGMTGIMGFLDYKAAGELWTEEEIGLWKATSVNLFSFWKRPGC